MVCDICGRQNQVDSTACTFCGSTTKKYEKNENYYENSNLDLGFSRPESNYIKAKVIKSIERDEETDISAPKEVMIAQNEFASFIQSIKESIHYLDKKIGRKKSIITLGIMTIVIILIIAANIIFSMVNEYKLTLEAKEAIEIYSNNENNETFVYNTKGEVLHKLNESTIPIWSSQNCSSALLRSETGNNYYYVNENAKRSFQSDEYAMGISRNGKLIYSTYNSEGYQLKLLDLESQTEIIIDQDKELSYQSVSISPDGRSYGYSKGLKTNDYTDCEAFIRINGEEPASIGKGIIIFVVSDNCDYLYYVQLVRSSEFEFYVKREGESILISPQIYSINFNQDYSEIIYTNTEGTFICSEGKESIKVSDLKLHEINAPIKSTINVYTGAVEYKIDSFKNKLITSTANELLYIDENYQAKLLASLPNFDNISVSRDWNDVTYISIMGDVTKISDLSGKMKKEILAEGAEGFSVSRDSSQLYFVKQMQYADYTPSLQQLVNQPTTIPFPLYELYYKKDNAQPILIASQVSDYQLNEVGNITFFIKIEANGNSRLYSSTNGGEATLVEGFNSVDSLEKWNYGIVVKEKINDRFNIYYNTSEKDFKLLLENVSDPVK